jgi:predicted acetyltransferase
VVLVKREATLGSDAVLWDMAEFFILRGYRRRGIGTKAAHEVWRRFPGQWQVRVMEINSYAVSFWEHAVAEFTGQPASCQSIEKDGKRWRALSFEASR